MANTLVFVDFPSDDVESSAKFYEEVFGWEVERRVPDVFCRIVPGGQFKNGDGSDSEIGNLHMGIYNVENARPHPDALGSEPRSLSWDARTSRVWVLVDENDSQERILDTAERLGATVLWRDHYWFEFNGLSGSFVDPWGNQINLWSKPDGFIEDFDSHKVLGEPDLPSHWTSEGIFQTE